MPHRPVGASPHQQTAPGPAKLPTHVVAASVVAEVLDSGAVRVSYRDQKNEICGPYDVTLNPMPDGRTAEEVKATLVNLIEVARAEYPDFSEVSFRAGPNGRGASGEVWTTQNSDFAKHEIRDPEACRRIAALLTYLRTNLAVTSVTIQRS